MIEIFSINLHWTLIDMLLSNGLILKYSWNISLIIDSLKNIAKVTWTTIINNSNPILNPTFHWFYSLGVCNFTDISVPPTGCLERIANRLTYYYTLILAVACWEVPIAYKFFIIFVATRVITYVLRNILILRVELPGIYSLMSCVCKNYMDFC